jgi:phage shock protein PspC (stress-responsive transcriptional regulator)
MINDTINQRNLHSTRSLRRSRDGMLGGVASGVATYFDVKPAYVRSAFAVLSVLGGGGLALYLAGWALIPEEGSDSSLAAQVFRRTTPQAS